MTGTTGRQRAILSAVEDIHVPAFSLPTQRKIAAISAPTTTSLRTTRAASKSWKRWRGQSTENGLSNSAFRDMRGCRWWRRVRLDTAGVGGRKLGDTIENIKEKVKPGKHLEPLPYVPIDCIPRRSIGLVEHKPSSEAKSSLIAFSEGMTFCLVPCDLIFTGYFCSL